jgi:hypothetical protein
VRETLTDKRAYTGGIQILSKINFRNLKKIYISCKSTLFPFDPFSYKKTPQIIPPPKLKEATK